MIETVLSEPGNLLELVIRAENHRRSDSRDRVVRTRVAGQGGITQDQPVDCHPAIRLEPPAESENNRRGGISVRGFHRVVAGIKAEFGHEGKF